MTKNDEKAHRMTWRCQGWDYRQPCIYQITIVLADRRSKALGRLLVADGHGNWVEPAVAKSLGLKPEEVEAKVELSELGAAILAHWKRIGEFTPEIRPLYCQIMPDHLHAILQVTRPMKRPLGNAIGGFKTGCEKIYRQLALPQQNEWPLALPRQNGQQLARPQQNGQPLALTGAGSAGSVPSARADGLRLFAPGFQDTILFREGQLAAMFNYLAENPFRLAVKTLFPELFRVVGDLEVALPGFGPSATGHFAALGNRFLLKRQLVQVQVSRQHFRYRRMPKPGGGLKIARDERGEPLAEIETDDFRARKAELLAAAKHGAVLLSPCVSDGERQIAREALEAGMPLVTMSNKGFSKLQKPSGRYFDACSDGRLLMLAPAAWPYSPGEKAMTRFDATAMNRLCQAIAGDGAAEINYHGMKPSNVDALAREAAKIETRGVR